MVGAHESEPTAQQLEVVRKVLLSLAVQILADRPCEEEDHDDGRRNPKGPVEIWVSVENVKEVGPRIDGG